MTNCVKCAGNGVTFNKSGYAGNYTLKCDECGGTGKARVNWLARIGIITLVLLVIGAIVFFAR